MKRKLVIIFMLFFLSFNYGCNTIAGTAKGLVEDIKSVVPGV